MAVVERTLADIDAGVLVHGALCFVDADLPLLGALAFNGYPLLYPKRLARRINGAGPLRDDQLRAVASALARRLPPA